ncbi:hypothetical protein BTVI_48720 [Pitangus sulphuratus]|nr:hypothetical protein BTVI_48720 [Pitangus sulphuratus]
MRKMDRKANYKFPIKDISQKELESFEKANIKNLPASFSYKRILKVIMKALLVCTAILPKLEEDRKIQAKQKAEEREGISFQSRGPLAGKNKKGLKYKRPR